MGIIQKFFEALLDPKAATWSAGVSFNRSNPLPLDKWSVFQSMDDATAYAESNAVAYPGQVIAVYNNGKMVAYVLSEDVENAKLVLEPIGIIPTGDGAISVDANGVISIGIDGVTLEVVDGALTLVGFEDAPEGAQLVKAADGTLSWVKPDLTTVEGLQTAIETLKQDIQKIEQALNPTDEDGNPIEGGLVSDVKDLEDAVGEEAVYDENGELISEATGIFKDIEEIEDKIGNAAEYDSEGSLIDAATGLYAELDKKANAEDVYTKAEADEAAEEIVKTYVASLDHLERKIVVSEDSIEVDAEDADRYIYMVPNDRGSYDEYMVINGILEKVGDWTIDLGDYPTIESVEAALELKANASDVENELEKKVDKVDGSRLMTDAEGAKLADIETGAQKNYITDVEDDFEVTEGKLALVKVDSDKVVGLSEALEEVDTALAGKVDAVEGARLITDEEANKLAAIADESEKNVINSVSNDFEIISDDVLDRQLVLKPIPISKVADLQSELDKKVASQEGWTLLSPTDQEKLARLAIDTDTDDIVISATVNVENVQGLEDWLNKNAGSIKGLSENNLTNELNTKLIEQLFIKTVDTNELNVTDAHLSIKSVDLNKVTGLNDVLALKASAASVDTLTTKVSELENSLNLHMTDADARMDAIEERLMWHGITG